MACACVPSVRTHFTITPHPTSHGHRIKQDVRRISWKMQLEIWRASLLSFRRSEARCRLSALCTAVDAAQPSTPAAACGSLPPCSITITQAAAAGSGFSGKASAHVAAGVVCRLPPTLRGWLSSHSEPATLASAASLRLRSLRHRARGAGFCTGAAGARTNAVESPTKGAMVKMIMTC